MCSDGPPRCGVPARRPNWRDYFLGIAEAVAKRADCSRRQIGAVLVQDDRIVSTGYNGSPPGKPGCLTDGACPRAHSDVLYGSSYDTGPGACIALHAEQNVILYSSLDERRGATLYVTDIPCDGCKRLITGSGIKEVIFPCGELRVK
jgi:dCMP deaminase